MPNGSGTRISKGTEEKAMKQRKPIPRRRKTPRRKRPELFHGHKAVRLHGKAREKRRAEIFARAGGRCEEMVDRTVFSASMRGPWYDTFRERQRCNAPATEWSHKKHGARKCDCLDCGIASCADCHRKRHNAGGKPVPRKVRA